MMGGLTAAEMLAGYARGIFPMAESAADPNLYWFEPELRGILPIGRLHLSRSMRRFMARSHWQARLNGDFMAVVQNCADRPETWINEPLKLLYQQLHAMGHAHSIEVYDGDELVGGTFGLTLGAAFFAESMFSRRSNGSKMALFWLSQHLARCGFTLWDTQYPNPHLASLGGISLPRREYRRRLSAALRLSADITAQALPDAQALLQEITQTS
ncbi:MULTISPECIES: leucyl/phenylalanyl-tRNA--protein transferase [unclassified Paracoccus (in: a-proteobacteria)]|uniref:leucyl/phenylalanyl-tRNA--protein transferase n=1 Tax=unclassified Paracoccus (in: a-proteobacteria) TaxID=2688777 RepID=UPI0012B1EF3A|nr:MULTISPECIES: leucyl/phenylalanyl-tRNA--protein transferase [unclassified Paracoccus (in: a-proteobacteria)]UXU74694.1 leucyl/phenylalanyl-tRNA--protein transferase [Paracoccus sp. SMMA_5]UXU80590.1 leucyl/phenylalanyl-tRNA--protein transferase [Paracoccus sp. SMMA_5_TC]